MLNHALFRLQDSTVSVAGDGIDLVRVTELLSPYIVKAAADGGTTKPCAPLVFESSALRPPAVDGALRVLADPRSTADQIRAFQLVRGILVASVLRTHASLHGAVVSYGGQGIVLTGAKGSGKTSFVSAMLRQVPALDFVTNDKAVVSPLAGDVIGLPYAVAVGHVGRGMASELRSLPARSIGEKALFWPAAFASSFSSRLVARTRPAAVVLCEADFTAARADLVEDVDDAERRNVMERDMADFGDAMVPEHLVGAPRSAPPHTAVGLPPSWPALPWLRLRGNPWAMRRDTVVSLLAVLDSGDVAR